MFATAPAPVRAHTSITLSAGLLNIPLSVYTSTESTRVDRKEFFNGDANIEVGRQPYRKDTGAVIESADVTRMAEAFDPKGNSKGWVILTDDEIAACTSERGLAEVVTFIPAKDIDQYLTEGLYQVRAKAEKGKTKPGAARALALLFAGMRQRKVAALVKVAMRGPARYAILTDEGDFRLVLTADAVRLPLPLDSDFRFTKDEVAMATSLIDAMGIDTPLVTDETAPVVQAYVNSKAGGAPTKKSAPAPDPTDNLMAAFQATIDAATAKKKGGKVA